MGLDNIPHRYPCREQRTAVMNGDQIDCAATIAAGGCPWKTAYDTDQPGRPLQGMLGTHCWWRGKTSHWHLGILEQAGHPLPETLADGFYGNSDHEPNLTPEHCRDLAAFLEDHAEAFVYTLAPGQPGNRDDELSPHDIRDEIDLYRYAPWWLRWAADNCGGVDAWW